MRTTFYRTAPPFLPPLNPAFSLVEVMLALAIASLGFITMLGLLPQGLQQTRDAALISAESRIKQKLTGELLTASWDQLTWSDYGPNRYFNDQGIELSHTDLTDESGTAQTPTYVAAVQMPTIPLDLRLPNNGEARPIETFLRRVKICIATSPDPDFNFVSAPERLVRTYTAILAKTHG